jgi:hypothetical protein
MTRRTTLRIDVTAQDITGALRRVCGSCPVARALRRCSGEEHVLVGVCRGIVGLAAVDLPIEAQQFIAAFDDGEPVQPFTFEVSW